MAMNLFLTTVFLKNKKKKNQTFGFISSQIPELLNLDVFV